MHFFRVSILIAFIGTGSCFQSQLSFAYAQSQEPVIVRLHDDTVVINVHNVKIADVATISSNNLATRNQIAQLDLGELQGNEPRSISKEKLFYRIRLAGIGSETFTVEGAEFVNIRFVPPEESIAILQQTLHERLAEYFHVDPERLVLEIPKFQQDSVLRQLRGVRSEEDLRVVYPTALPLGSATIKLKWLSDDANGRFFNVPVEIRKLETVVMATRPIAKDELIPPEAIQESVVPVGRTGILLASAEELVGRPAARDIQAHSIIEAGAISRQPIPEPNVVHANETIEVICKFKDVDIRLRGVRALQNGKVGDWIDALNTKSNKKIRCQVLDSHTAALTFTNE